MLGNRIGVLLLAAFAMLHSTVAQQMTQTPTHDVTTDTGGKAHIYFSTPVEKQNRAARTLAPVNNLKYGTGPVMRNPTNFVIFWQPPGRAAFPAGYQAAIEKYFHDVGGTPFYNIVTQYNDNTGTPVPNATTLGAPAYTDTTTAAPSGCNGSIGAVGATPNCPLTDGDIQNEVKVALAANPQWGPPTINTEYFVYTPSDVDQCMNASNPKNPGNAADCWAINGGPGTNEKGDYCAYHSFFNGNTIYAYQPFASNGACYPFPGGPTTFPNGNVIDIVTSPTSHEMIESNTDPLLGAWLDSTGAEIGDKCAYNYGYFAPDGTNFVLNGDRYQIQQEWSNDVSGCAKRYGPTPGTSISSLLDFGTLCAGSKLEKDLVIQNTSGEI